MTLSATLLFHVNLRYSSIEREGRVQVVRRAYRPLLELFDQLPWLVGAVEVPAHSLELIDGIDPEWVPRLRALVGQGRVELVGSGDTQLIGPLVPEAVHRWNQRLGAEAYEAAFGLRPTTALVAEMAWSQGLIDAYLDAGYQRLVMEWNNPRRQHPEWEDDWRHGVARSTSPRGRTVDVLFADTLAFQKFQRAVQGDLSRAEYVEWLATQEGVGERHLFLYANDAEVFGVRPGRYTTEPPLEDGPGEWARMAALLEAVRGAGVRFTTPERWAERAVPAQPPCLTLSSAADPVPVKKQPKYNVTRWGASGRDDLGLNAACHARARGLAAEDAPSGAWRALCRDWASDLRTHLTERRWAEHRASDPSRPSNGSPAAGPLDRPTAARVERDGRFLRLETDGVRAVFDTRRGLALEALTFPAVQAAPLVGTLRHGAFEDVEWMADFYSGHTVLEVPANRRVTDLEPIEPQVDRTEGYVEVCAAVPTALGPLPKRWRVFADRVELELGLSAWGQRPLGTVRAASVTLFPEAFADELFVSAASGGAPERHRLEGDFDHGAAVSSLISARAGFGATDGRLVLDDGRVALELAWAPERTAPVPLLTHRRIGRRRFVRLALSCGEIDETLRPGAPLRDLGLTLSARRIER